MNMKTTIICNEDLYNNGKCFTKGQTYEVNGNVLTEAGLMDKKIKNDLNEDHYIGKWWRKFSILDV